MAVSRVLISIVPKLCNMRIRWFSDNQNVVGILQVGSHKPHLQEQAMKVFDTKSGWSLNGCHVVG